MRAVTDQTHRSPRSQGDLQAMAAHASTVFVGQIAVMGFGVVDTIVAGRHSDVSLAALSIGSAVFITVYVSLMGLLQALLPVWAEMHGARRPADVGPSARQSLYVCAAASVLGMAVLLHPAPRAPSSWRTSTRPSRTAAAATRCCTRRRCCAGRRSRPTCGPWWKSIWPWWAGACRRRCCSAPSARSTRRWASRGW